MLQVIDGGGPSGDKPRAANPEMVKAFEDMLAWAKDGKIRGLYAAIVLDERGITRVQECGDADPADMLLALEMMKLHLIAECASSEQ